MNVLVVQIHSSDITDALLVCAGHSLSSPAMLHRFDVFTIKKKMAYAAAAKKHTDAVRTLKNLQVRKSKNGVCCCVGNKKLAQSEHKKKKLLTSLYH